MKRRRNQRTKRRNNGHTGSRDRGKANKFTMKITVDGVDEELNLSDADTLTKLSNGYSKANTTRKICRLLKPKKGFAQWQMQGGKPVSKKPLQR